MFIGNRFSYLCDNTKQNASSGKPSCFKYFQSEQNFEMTSHKIDHALNPEHFLCLDEIARFPSHERAVLLEKLCSKMLSLGFIPRNDHVVSSFQAIYRNDKELLSGYAAIREFMESLTYVAIDIPMAAVCALSHRAV